MEGRGKGQDLLSKDGWRWPRHNLAGNTIDFLVQVLGLSFHQGTWEITGR